MRTLNEADLKEMEQVKGMLSRTDWPENIQALIDEVRASRRAKEKVRSALLTVASDHDYNRPRKETALDALADADVKEWLKDE